MFKNTLAMLAFGCMSVLCTAVYAADIQPGERFVIKAQNFSQEPNTIVLECTAKAGNGDMQCGTYNVTPEGEYYKDGRRRGIQYTHPAGGTFAPGATWENNFTRYYGEKPRHYTLTATTSASPESITVGGKSYSVYTTVHTGIFTAPDLLREREVKITVWHSPALPLWVKIHEEIFFNNDRKKSLVQTLEEHTSPIQTSQN